MRASRPRPRLALLAALVALGAAALAQSAVADGDAPPVAVDDVLTLDEDTPEGVDVLANDTDADLDELTVTTPAPEADHGAVDCAPEGVCLYSPDADYAGSDSFTYAVSDGNGGSDTAVVTVTVTPVNDPPRAEDDDILTAEGTPGDVDVLANDFDIEGNTLSLDSHTQANDGSVTCVGGDCEYTPNPNFVGADFFEYTVSDGNGGSDTGLVFVLVTSTNNPPDADDDSLTTVEDTPGDVDVLDGDTDPDGDPLEVVSENPFADHGTVECAPAGVCTYTPDPNFEGSDEFVYTVSDGQGGETDAVVLVTVTAVNDDPVAVDDSLTLEEDTQGSLNVRLNDSDVDGDTVLVTTPNPAASHGTVNCLGGGACTYIPTADYNGPDSFQYSISDGNGGTDTATVNITVNPENFAPIADDDALTTAEDAAGGVNVLAGDTDPDGDDLSVSSPSPTAAHGTVSCAAAGTCTYTPQANWSGSDSFEYTVSDGHGGLDTGLVTVTVTPANDAPVAVDDGVTSAEDGQGQVDVLPNDSDVDGDSVTVTGSTNGAHGTVSCAAGGMCTYTPAANYEGSDTFTYTIGDGNGGSDNGSVTVTVTPENDAPVADDDALTTEVNTNGDVNVLAGDVDVDGDDVTVDATSDPDHGSVSCTPEGDCTYTPDADYLGADSFTYTVTDGTETDEGLVTVTVEAANVAPTCANVKPSKATLWPAQRQFVTVILSGAADPDADPLVYVITAVTQDEKTKGVTGAGDKPKDAQRISGKPSQIKLRSERAPKANGRVYRIVYTVSDGRGGSCTGVEKVGVPVKKGKKAVETAKTYNSFA